jgi:hypothetical protein
VGSSQIVIQRELNTGIKSTLRRGLPKNTYLSNAGGLFLTYWRLLVDVMMVCGHVQYSVKIVRGSNQLLRIKCLVLIFIYTMHRVDIKAPEVVFSLITGHNLRFGFGPCRGMWGLGLGRGFEFWVFWCRASSNTVYRVMLLLVYVGPQGKHTAGHCRWFNMWGLGQHTLLDIVVGLCGASGNTLYWVLLVYVGARATHFAGYCCWFKWSLGGWVLC